MSTGTWIRRQRDRPIAEHERRAAMAAVTVLLTATALLLAVTQASTTPRHITSSEPRSAVNSAPAVPRSGTEARTALSPAIEAAAAHFLAGYLPYLYGHAPASQVQGATASFARSLAPLASHVSPSMRASTPRLVAFRPAAAPPGVVAVTAVVNDGGLVDYPIALLLVRRGSRLLVSGLGGA
jgi:hypothetical protein